MARYFGATVGPLPISEAPRIHVHVVISRNGPYIGGHLAFYFKLNFKQVYNVL